MFRNPTTDLLLALVIVLLILGPKRLPSLGRSLGQGMREFKDSITGHSKGDEDEERAELPAGRSAGHRIRPGFSRVVRAARLGHLRGAGSMAKALRPIGHEDRLSIVDHLDELRSRLIVCGLALAVAFGFCFWQNHSLLNVLNRALPGSPKTTANHISGLTSDTVKEARGLDQAAAAAAALSQSKNQSPADRQLFAQLSQGASNAAKALPHSTANRLPITIGVGEPFTTTLTISFYFALLFALPVLIYQGYAFVIPALNPGERRVALPAMGMAPVLFIAGVLFAYIVVLPPAVRFLQGYNNQSFDILVQARTYYKFEIFTMLGVGVAFQLPLGLLALQRLGAVSARTLTRHWRYAVVIIAVIAAAMPGADPVTTALETLPLILLYLASIVLLKIADRRAAARAAAESGSSFGDGLDPT
jgi:sec-independent protein translocase protein TatC